MKKRKFLNPDRKDVLSFIKFVINDEYSYSNLTLTDCFNLINIHFDFKNNNDYKKLLILKAFIDDFLTKQAKGLKNERKTGRKPVFY